jgi:DNA (cytosine-5)-methyltransferase 1
MTTIELARPGDQRMITAEPVLPGLAGTAPQERPCRLCAGLGALEATDIFCGAGGSSLGLEFVRCWSCGRSLIKVTQAINHWDLAVLAHNANFPHADHDVHNVKEIPPGRFRRTALLWASPECVNHANCKGKRDDSPEAQRSRATFKDIVRFTAHHRYDVVIVENVVEARLWCEHDNCACGAEFDAWFQAMLDEGYEGQIVYFNSQFALPTPQSRDRMYVILSGRRGLPRPNLDFRPLSWCSACQTVVRGVQTWKRPSRGSAREAVREWGRYGAQYMYLCPNTGCAQPVSPAVVGARSIIDFSLPITRIADKPSRACSACGRRHPVACNTRRRIKTGWATIASRVPARPSAGGELHERDGYARVWAVDALLQPTAATGRPALATPAGSHDAKAWPADEPVHAVTGGERLAMVLRAGGQSVSARDVGSPVGTITGHDRQMGLVLQTGGPTGSGRNARTTLEPTGTVMPDSHSALVMRGRAAREGLGTGEAETAQDAAGRPVTGSGEARLAAAPGYDPPGHRTPQAFTGAGTDQGLLVYNGVPGFVLRLSDAIGTITSRDKQALLVPYFRTGVARPLGQPAGTVTARDREALVISDADIDNFLLRMVQWPELLRAQVMHRLPSGDDYLLTARRRDARGRVRELSSELRVRMIGNAVSAPVATMLGAAALEILR